MRDEVGKQNGNSVSVRMALAGSAERHAERLKEERATGAVAALGTHIMPQALADALAVFAMDLIGVLPRGDQTDMLERLANRLDNQARTPNGGQAAAMLGAIGGSLMRMGL